MNGEGETNIFRQSLDRPCYIFDMNQHTQDSTQTEEQGYEAPSLRVLNLNCEISAYAPDDEPLF